ncbi:MAG TPA: DUF885 domain-containing protein [Gemmatimonadales bacterium]|nr:DUF885 domain-containing protein [Gemmatimonadales bacterium]
MSGIPAPRLTVALLSAALLACSARPSTDEPSPAPSPSDGAVLARRVNAVADDYYRWFLESRPLSAFLSGVPEAALDRLNENSLADLERTRNLEDEWLARLREIPPESLAGTPARVTHAVLGRALEAAVARRVCRDELWSVSQQGGVQLLPARLAALQPVGTPEQRRKALARFRALEPFVDTETAKLREGVRRGYTSPRIAVEAVVEQLDGLLRTPPEASPMLVLAERDSAPGFRDSVIGVLATSLYPSLARYREYLRGEYLPRAREETAVAALPGGAECYRARVRDFTTLDLDPETIHRTGHEEIARIEAEARPIAERRFGTSDVAAVFRGLRADPQSQFGSRGEVLDSAEAALTRARAALPRWFGRLPRAGMLLDPCLDFEEKAGCPNSYLPPAQDGSRPGRWRINTNPQRASRVDLESIAFHEGYPGHHLDLALNQERAEAHPVTRIMGNSGFSEGWGLYAEELASEMGLYSGDLAQLGRLSSAAFRAARLVVDPGLHALGWSRERAIEYMLAHTVLSRETVTSEVDRYIVNPGQATAYMLGRLEISRLRGEAERRLGPKFDIRAFHDQVLGQGRVPLPFLRQEVERWIASVEEPA